MEIKNDRLLEIATANSRRAKKWKNKNIKWSELLDRLSEPTRTGETVAEFKRMSRDQQSDIKDVGGYVGGYCKNGDRTNTISRSIITLDADEADGDIWDDFTLLYDVAACVYSTHKHTPEQMRLRLVIPLNRDVEPDEYQAISRRIAAILGINKFDDTTYQPQRLMFWPSCSIDGEYVFKYQDGAMLDADVILATYRDWHDVTSWPVSDRVAEIAVRVANDKQQDPTTKEGLIGVFCRTYTIEEAIDKFIMDYEPAGNGRYTYTKGTTAEGVVTYDNKFSYSFHSTDPASSQLCNAWDLVRLHLFSELDAKCDEDTPVNKLPSFKAMQELASSDEQVKINLVNERAAEAARDFEVLDDVDEATGEILEPEANDWQTKLQINKQGEIVQTIDNIVIILSNDKRLKGVLAFNEFEGLLTVARAPAWRGTNGPKGHEWTNNDDSNLRHYLERAYGISNKDKISDAINIVAARNGYHPVREYLDGCSWDGVERLDTLLIKYLGAADNEYVRAVTRKTLVAAVARIYNAGCKFDNMLTIRGRQGLGKSSIIAKLAGPYFSDSFSTVTGKEAYEQLLGRWIIEVGELAAMKKSEVEATKLFISKQEDRYRPAYAARVESFPRQCIFIATTNETQFLRDTTGNRRYWIVDTPNKPSASFWDDLTPEVIKYIWGEAKRAYEAGESLILSPRIEAKAREVQEAYTEENAKAGIVQDYLERLLPEGWDELDTYERRQWLESDAVGTVKRTAVTHIEIWSEALQMDRNRLDRYATQELIGIMQTIKGWTYRPELKRTFKPYGRQRFYERDKEEDGGDL